MIYHILTANLSFTQISILVLIAVLVLISARSIMRPEIKIWHIMLCGALAVLALGQISVWDAAKAINYDVIVFLAGAFIVGRALSESGALNPYIERFFANPRTENRFFLIFIAAAGFLSAFLMNDTVAIIGTLFAITLSKRMNISAEILLMTLAFSVTTGSVLSPVGNPQNLLIALSEGFTGSAAFGGLSAASNPFVVFGAYLILPTLISLLLIYPVMKLCYPNFSAGCGGLAAIEGADGACGTKPDSSATSEVAVVDEKLAKIAKLSLGVLVFMILLKGAASFFNYSEAVRLPIIAVAAALPVILFSKRRFDMVAGIDWGTIIFFAAMFVLMQSAWDSGFIQGLLNLEAANAAVTGTAAGGLNAGGAEAGTLFTSASVIYLLGITVSQLVSNVPFVALFLPLMADSGANAAVYMALAAGSTLAGNLLIFGAASNLIIIQNAERYGSTIGFLNFARVGIPLTVAQSAVFLLWFLLIGA
ncbi:MAG: anion transporter [Methanomicrobium sp.]|nr:anion transporter [Methanomicrobium sp.]